MRPLPRENLPFGLTGGVASGKSTVARMFEELGARVIDADRIGHELIRPPHPAYHEILERFGQTILDDSGQINRARLGAIVFSDAEKLRQLNRILHPRIMSRVDELAREARVRDPRRVILVDAALIYEAGLVDRFQSVIVTWCKPEQQLERLMAGRGLSREEAERRISNQMPGEEKRRRADFVIDCSGTLDETRRQVESLYLGLKRMVDQGSKD
ncbi:MAG TPA: dephospho-CoA kinase [Terriglobia bacterium]|nr:dephospho-CoA kinase [Terriglobia bacterium]